MLCSTITEEDSGHKKSLSSLVADSETCDLCRPVALYIDLSRRAAYSELGPLLLAFFLSAEQASETFFDKVLRLLDNILQLIRNLVAEFVAELFFDLFVDFLRQPFLAGFYKRLLDTILKSVGVEDKPGLSGWAHYFDSCLKVF